MLILVWHRFRLKALGLGFRLWALGFCVDMYADTGVAQVVPRVSCSSGDDSDASDVC